MSEKLIFMCVFFYLNTLFNVGNTHLANIKLLGPFMRILKVLTSPAAHPYSPDHRLSIHPVESIKTKLQ